MQTRKKAFLVAVCLAAAVLLVVTATRDREPHYADRPLSHWIQNYWMPHRAGWPIDQDTKQALSHIGTNAIPFLVKWISYKPSPIRDRTVAFLTRPSVNHLAGPIVRPLVKLICGTDARNAQPSVPVFSYVGTPALPPLLALLEKQPSLTNSISERVQMALSYYHTDEAIPFYLAYVANTNARNRPFVIRLLCGCPLVTNTAPAVNTLIDCLTNSDTKLALAAKAALCSPPGLETKATFVPYLSSRLATCEDTIVRSNIVVVLGDMGLRWTLPAVEAALKDHDPNVRIAATNVFQNWIRSVHPSRQADLSRRLTQP